MLIQAYDERSLTFNTGHAQVDVPSFGAAVIHKQCAVAAIDVIFGSLHQPKDLARAAWPPDAIVYAAKDSGRNAISPKSNRTVVPCSSTPKLLGCMSGCVNMRRSSLISTGSTGLAGSFGSLERPYSSG